MINNPDHGPYYGNKKLDPIGYNFLNEINNNIYVGCVPEDKNYIMF